MTITLSMSAIHTFLRCPKKFDIYNVRGWADDKPESEALTQGTHFHAYMQQYAKKCQGVPYEYLDWATPMGEIAIAYIKYRGFPKNAVLSADDPHYINLFPNVLLRTTFDLVYDMGDMLVIRDYKTFERAPSMDIDLDFQARTYLAAASIIWPDYETYMFEHEYVRRTLPNVPKDKSGNKWSESDCYKQQQMILTKDEMAEDWEELGFAAASIISLLEEVDTHWLRVPLKGGGYDDCSHCPIKNLCKAEKQGNLNTESDYLALAVKRETIYD